ncbi:MAG: hypothetical protein ACOX5Z_13140 [Desulfobulbus sp.]|jgi:hypothetical protein
MNTILNNQPNMIQNRWEYGKITRQNEPGRADETKASQPIRENVQLYQGSDLSPVTYTSSLKISADTLERYGVLKNMVLDIFRQQGINTQIALDGKTIDLESISQEEAQELIGENGYFGVEQTSERIFQFAIGIAGGDVGKLDVIKAGVNQGFAEAKRLLGDWLPEISQKTYDAVMNKLDTWAALPPTDTNSAA